MDPEAVYRSATDPDNEEPEFAALELLVWLAAGGYVDEGIGLSRAGLARKLELIVINALEAS